MAKKVYLCNTYYHLLISVIKAMKDSATSSVVLFSDIYNDKLVQDKELINRLKASKIFENVKIFDYSKIEIKFQEGKMTAIKRFFLTMFLSFKDELKLKKYEEVYIFFDENLLGHILNKKRIYYHLLEDGTDSFKTNYFSKKTESNSLKDKIKYLLNFRKFGESKYIKSIEVNNIDEMIQNLKQLGMYEEKMIINEMQYNCVAL